jgi:hypothetical protein
MGARGSKQDVTVDANVMSTYENVATHTTEKVLGGKVERLNAIKMGGKTSMQGPTPDNRLKPLNGIATELVVAEFFASSGTLYSFLLMVNTVFTISLRQYAKAKGLRDDQVVFVFKGGNILRIIAHQFFTELPRYASEEIEEFYSQFFKRADNDFGIYLDPEIPNYEDVYDELGTLSYHLQFEIRRIVRASPATYFDFSRYNAEFAEKVLNAWLPKFREIYNDDFKSVTLRSVEADSTRMFLKDDFENNERQVATAYVYESNSTMKITHNNALDFSSTTRRSKFNLTRTKIHFALHHQHGHTTNVSGELIDVSISHRDDMNVAHFFENVDMNVVPYTLKHPDTKLEITFRSFSLEYLTEDLELILFKSAELPWEDSKYVKRLNRLMYVYFIDIFIKRSDNASRMEVLRDFKTQAVESLRANKSVHAARFADSHSDLSISRGLDYIVKVSKKTPRSTKDGEEFISMLDIIDKNIAFLVGALEKIKEFCRTDGSANEEDIYIGDLRTFA